MFKPRSFAGSLRGPLAVTALLAVACASGLYAPRKGVTEQFFCETDDRTIEINNYDFSRLDDGYGLYVFSYEFRGSRGNNVTGWSPEEKEGVRVWEHKFSEKEWDVKKEFTKFKYWGYRDLTSLMLAKVGNEVTMFVTFHKGRIVYGGRLVVDSRTYYTEGPQVEFHFDEDMGPWLEAFGDEIADIKMDTVVMNAGY